MKIKSIIIIALFIGLGFSSCTKSMLIRGNGNVTTQIRELDDFSKLANNGSFEVNIIADSSSYVIIEAESNLIPYISTMVDNGALIIDSHENLNSRRSMKLEVHTPNLVALEINGSGNIDFETFYADHFSAVVDGSGNINGSAISESTYLRVNGSGNLTIGLVTENLDASIHGSGNIHMAGESVFSEMGIYGSGDIKDYDFIQEECEVNSNGSGNVYTTVTNSLKVKIGGSGSVHFKGNPLVQSEINGSGRVVKH